MKRVLILGGYGNFGSHIAQSLAPDARIQLLIAGRSVERSIKFVESLDAANRPETYSVDIAAGIDEFLAKLAPDMVIQTIGPFQGQNYAVAEACIRSGCHYVDLADGRAFVTSIGALDESARAAGVLVVSGASSVPALTAAVIDEALPRFSDLQEVDYAITAAQQTNRGLATAASVLSYVGRPFTTLSKGRTTTVYGWQSLHAERYPELGIRLFGNCDIPDLDLFPTRYPSLHTLRFFAGHEIKLLHLATWLLSWAVRLRVLPPLSRYAERLLKCSFWFDALGSSRSGFHTYLRGKGQDQLDRIERFYIIARQGHGLLIPCIPAIILAKRLACDELDERGARPCLDLIKLGEFLAALKHLDISTVRQIDEA